MAKKKKKGKSEFGQFFSPGFVKYLKSKAGVDGHIEPEQQDFDFIKDPTKANGQAEQYRLAAAHRIIRLHDEWRAMQN